MSDGGGLRAAWRWAWPQFPLAVVVGLAWWLLAPGGRSVLDQGYLRVAEAPGSQDSWLAVLGAGAGAVVALLWVARRPSSPDRASVVAIAAALLGALLAGVAAAGVGLALDLLAAPAQAGPGALTQLRLRAPAVPLLWPLALVLVVLVDTTRDMVALWLRQRRRRSTALS